MGIFDLFKKKDKTQTLEETDEQLRDELLDAIKRNHLTEFEMLCRQNEAKILKSFNNWKKTPDEYKNNPEAAQLYMNCLMIMANYFARELNRNDLHQMLAGIDDNEHSKQWQQALADTRKMMEELRVQEAIPILKEYADKGQMMSGMTAASLMPITLGHLGECYFQNGQAREAVDPTTRAMELVAQQGNEEATIAYLRNLYEIHRYLGEGEKAAEYAKRIADRLYEDGKLFLASNWRHQARAVTAGEPLLRVVVKIGDELFELNEIPAVKSEKVEFIFMRNRFELKTAMNLCEQGRVKAEEGKPDEAVALFEQAAALDKYNPTPHYFLAAVRMHQRKTAEAIAAYEKTEELAPGFESCRSELWLAQQIAAGKLDHDAYIGILRLVDDTAPAEERLAMVDDLLAKYPNFTEIHYQKGKLKAFRREREEAMAIWSQALQHAEDRDLKTRLYADMALGTEDKAEKLKLVAAGCQINGNLVAGAMCNYLKVQLEDELSSN